MTVAVDSIVYIESVGNYVKVHLADGNTLMSKLTLTHLLALLPAGEFLRIHRSFAVALNRLERFSAAEVMIAGKVLPVGRKFASGLPVAPQS